MCIYIYIYIYTYIYIYIHIYIYIYIYEERCGARAPEHRRYAWEAAVSTRFCRAPAGKRWVGGPADDSHQMGGGRRRWDRAREARSRHTSHQESSDFALLLLLLSLLLLSSLLLSLLLLLLMFIYIYIYTCININKYVCMYVCMYIYIYIYIYTSATTEMFGRTVAATWAERSRTSPVLAGSGPALRERYMNYNYSYV